MVKRFPPRVPELLRLEGWYKVPAGDNKTVEFKLSCRFHDILRCSTFNGKEQHFSSCYQNSKYSVNSHIPDLIASNPTFAIAYLPDKHGNFQARAWVRWIGWRWSKIRFVLPHVEIYSVYGNGLSYEIIARGLKQRDIRVRSGPYDPTATFYH